MAFFTLAAINAKTNNKIFTDETHGALVSISGSIDLIETQ